MKPRPTLPFVSLEESYDRRPLIDDARIQAPVFVLVKMDCYERMFSFLFVTKVEWPNPKPARLTHRGRFRACLRRWAGRISISVGRGQV